MMMQILENLKKNKGLVFHFEYSPIISPIISLTQCHYGHTVHVRKTTILYKYTEMSGVTWEIRSASRIYVNKQELQGKKLSP